MNNTLAAGILLVILTAVVLLGRFLRGRLPEAHLSPESKDSVKVSLGLVATMSALLLGLLVSSAKGSYDQQRAGVIQMAGKIAFLNRVLSAYGPEAAPVRAHLRQVTEGMLRNLWSGEGSDRGPTAADEAAGNALYDAVQKLVPSDDRQRGVKAAAAGLVVEAGQLRMTLQAQAVSSIPIPLLAAVMVWLAIIFLGFSTIAPANATATLSLLAAALSVAVALFLVMELDQPLAGLIRISPEPMLKALEQVRT